MTDMQIIPGPSPKKGPYEVQSAADGSLPFVSEGAVTANVTVNINAGLGKNAKSVFFINDGGNTFTYKLSVDGATFSDAITLKKDEFKIYRRDIHSIQLIHSADTNYRLEAYA